MNKPANISRERLRQLRKNAKGKCSVAGCERDMAKRRGGFCATHGRETANARRDRYYATRPELRKPQKCSKCEGTDHNSRRCDK